MKTKHTTVNSPAGPPLSPADRNDLADRLERDADLLDEKADVCFASELKQMGHGLYGTATYMRKAAVELRSTPTADADKATLMLDYIEATDKATLIRFASQADTDRFHETEAALAALRLEEPASQMREDGDEYQESAGKYVGDE